MKQVLNQYTLVMNKHFQAIGTCTVRTAIILMTRDAAKALTLPDYRTFTWEKWISDEDPPTGVNEYIARGQGNEPIPAPQVIVLTRYDQVFRRKVRFTQKAMYRRDGFICQYCLRKFNEERLSMDHVVPKSQGGKTGWENCVTACMDCNNKKADRSLKAMGWTLPKKPERPQWNPILHVRPENRPECWKQLVQKEWWDEVKSV